MRFDVLEPGLERAADPNLRGLLARQLHAPELEQVALVALEQALVEVLLRLEVVVDHRGGHTRAPGDLVDRGGVVAALREDLAGGLLDQLAAGLGR